MSFSQGYALVVGIGSYHHIPQYNVPITVADANAVCTVLQDPECCGYPPEQVVTLCDAAATHQGLLEALERLAAQADAESTVFFYYAGHGLYGSDGQYTLSTHDTQQVSGKALKGTGLSELELINLLRKIPARRMFLAFNACHAGEVSPSLGAPPPSGINPPAKLDAALLSTGQGRIILAACRPQQQSWIGPGQLTLFTQAIVDGLRGEGYVPNNQGYISAFGLYEHVYFTVKEAAARLGQVQEPELTVLRGVGPFPLALYRGASDLGAFDAAEPLPESTAACQVDPDWSLRAYNNALRQLNLLDMTSNITQVVKAEGGSSISGVTQQANVNQQARPGSIFHPKPGTDSERLGLKQNTDVQQPYVKPAPKKPKKP